LPLWSITLNAKAVWSDRGERQRDDRQVTRSQIECEEVERVASSALGANRRNRRFFKPQGPNAASR
jgi:hypothetical protein